MNPHILALHRRRFPQIFVLFAWLVWCGWALAAPAAAPQTVIRLPSPTPQVPPSWNGSLAPEIPLRAGWVRSGDQFVPASALRRSSSPTSARAGQTAALSVGGNITKWPDGRVPYSYDSSMTPARKRVFEAACREWEKYADVHFVPRVGQPNYLNVIGGDGNGSYLGVTGGGQPLILAGNAVVMVGCHELGHALGIIHEHQRPGRDEYISIHPENANPDFVGVFDVVEGALNQGDYDFESVMHYGDYAFSINGKRTITAQPKYAEFQKLMGQDTHLSEGDKRGMALIYGASKISAASISNATVSETPGGSMAQLTVTLTQSASQPIIIHWETRDGSALAGSDYQATVGRLTFAPGELSKTLEVPILDDNFIERDETLSVRLSNEQGATISEFDRDGLITIGDNDILTLESPPVLGYYLDDVDFGDCVASTNLDNVTSMQFLARPMITGRVGQFTVPDDGTSFVKTVPIRSTQKGDAVFIKFVLTHPAFQEIDLKVRTPDGYEFGLSLPYGAPIYDLTQYLKGHELIGDWRITARDTVKNANSGTLDDIQILVAPTSGSETLLATDSDGADSQNQWSGAFDSHVLGNGNYIFIARAFQGSTALGDDSHNAIYVNHAGAPPALLPTLSPIFPTTNQTLTAEANAFASDSGALTTSYDFRVNGKSVQSGSSSSLDLSQAGNGDKNDVITCEITVTSEDGRTATASAQTTVINSAPIAFSSKGEVDAATEKGFALNTFDADGDALTYQRVGGPRNGVQADIRVDEADGKTKLFYRSRPFYGGVDIIRFVARDSDGKLSNESTLGINVLYTPPPPANRAPIAGDTSIDTYVGKSEIKGLLGSDPDGDAIIFRIVGNAKYGRSEIRRDADGAFKLFYTSLNRFYGDDVVTYIVTDSRGKESNLATVKINFINRAPLAQGNKIGVASGEVVSQYLFGSDEDGDALSFRLVNNPRYGKGEVKLDAQGKWRFYYQSLPGYVGPDQITFIAIDPQGKESSVAALDINVVRVSGAASATRGASEAPSGAAS